MKKYFVFFLLCCRFAAFSQTDKPYFQQRADFTIDVILNDVSRTLDAFEVINYTNNSPDTLSFIWFHLWPNAYKNDRTAFSEQLLKIGRTDFYFSNEEQRGYINRLDFKINNKTALIEAHPHYIDIIKVILPEPLYPGQSVRISTPFHVKLPFNFSRGGYIDNTFQITQWYPKPAVYDREGWHPMPYLDQGEFYSEFGDYNVNITVPEKYIVASTGTEMSPAAHSDSLPLDIPRFTQKVAGKTKTYQYVQKDIHDFAWFADKQFIELKDTLQLPSGRIIAVRSYYTPSGKNEWKNSITFLKNAVLTRSRWLGEYPYDEVKAVEAKMGFEGGMEYPTITSISPVTSAKSLDLIIEHEVGHNWNYGILATNERDFPWMDEGINSYYDNRYEQLYYGNENAASENGFLEKKMPKDYGNFLFRIAVANKKDQPINSRSQDFSEINYGTIAYTKAGEWMKLLEDYVGTDVFDNAMHTYYDQWKFKHPYATDLQKIFRETSTKNTDSIFSLLSNKGHLSPPTTQSLKPTFLFNLRETDRYHYISFLPALGGNYYDKIMVGAMVHNYSLPEPKFNFILAPMYATGSKKLTGIGRLAYQINSYGMIRKTEFAISGATFSMKHFVDSIGGDHYFAVKKLVPSLRLTFRNADALSTVTQYIQWKTFFLTENQLAVQYDTINKTQNLYFPEVKRYLNQFIFKLRDDRVLYPYEAQIMAEQSKEFVKLGFEGNYFFNFANGGGISARLFAGKFIYLIDKTILSQNQTKRYHLNMSGSNGEEDYTYSNYFIGRNEFDNFASQQMMIKDGAFKVRTDFLYSKIGKTDDWLSAINLKSDINSFINTQKIFPVRLPIKLFMDIGTYADAWQKDATTGKFIYDAGLQLSLLKDVVNIYVPLVYSKVYRNYFNSLGQKNLFLKNISFSIDLQKVRLSKWLPGID